jgi:CubicO group peptidase (beta-lactamase class C family)
MAPGRAPDERKEQHWRRWINPWRASGLTGRAFCARHGLSSVSFYNWRRGLETHRSGLPNFEPGTKRDGRRDYPDDDFAALALSRKPAFARGTHGFASNPGSGVLGGLVGKFTGHHAGALLRERGFGPLGMKTARVLRQADIVPPRAAGYNRVKGAWKHRGWNSPSASLEGAVHGQASLPSDQPAG